MDLIPIVLAIGATALILAPIVVITVGALITGYFEQKTKMVNAAIEKLVMTVASGMMTYTITKDKTPKKEA